MVLLPCSGIAANTFLYGVDAGVGETDNVTLAPSNKTSQTLAVADFDFNVKEQTRLLDLAATGNLSYLDYLQNAFHNQLLGRVDGTAQFAIIPDRITWTVQDDFGQTAIDPFTPTTPNNVEDVNYFSTGPNLHLRLGGTAFMDLSARYARVQYETSPFNSNRLIGDVSFGRRLSAASSVSLNADTERVLFSDTTVATDFDRTNVFAGYQLQGARTELSAQLGGTRVEQSGDSTNGALATVQLSRKVSAASRITLSAGRELTDAGASFSGLQSGASGVVGAAPAPQTANSFTDTYASAGWQYDRNRTSIGLSGRWDQNMYPDQAALNNNRGGVEFRVIRRLTHSFTAQVIGSIYRSDYPRASINNSGTPTASEEGSSFTDGTVAAILTWRYGRALEINLRGEHSLRDASGFVTGYHENRAFLTVGYRPRTAEAVPFPSDEPAT
jgi:hypothetical protein